mmetsp:Transcript_13271/g.42330  ORF Transcript_13271/g.42330 Transcript_13271/m.42330 type:complete len:353 (+) Transcript_13271:580-1638(+)
MVATRTASSSSSPESSALSSSTLLQYPASSTDDDDPGSNRGGAPGSAGRLALLVFRSSRSERPAERERSAPGTDELQLESRNSRLSSKVVSGSGKQRSSMDGAEVSRRFVCCCKKRLDTDGYAGGNAAGVPGTAPTKKSGTDRLGSLVVCKSDVLSTLEPSPSEFVLKKRVETSSFGAAAQLCASEGGSSMGRTTRNTHPETAGRSDSSTSPPIILAILRQMGSPSPVLWMASRDARGLTCAPPGCSPFGPSLKNCSGSLPAKPGPESRTSTTRNRAPRLAERVDGGASSALASSAFASSCGGVNGGTMLVLSTTWTTPRVVNLEALVRPLVIIWRSRTPSRTTCLGTSDLT